MQRNRLLLSLAGLLLGITLILTFVCLHALGATEVTERIVIEVLGLACLIAISLIYWYLRT